MSAMERRYAVQGRGNLEQDRLTYMVEHMPANKAYRIAAEQAGGDPDGALLARFRDRYRWYRQGWRGHPRQAIDARLSDRFYRDTGQPPLCVDIETAASCDLACPFCFRQSIATPDKLMSPELCTRIIDQCAELGVPSMKFNWRGEPLLHPKLAEFVAYAKQRGTLETILNTDAVTLDERKSRALIESGLDLLIYSFDGGTKATYEKMRPGRFRENRFEEVYANIRRFAEIRRELGAPFPRTQIQMVLTAETYHEQDAFFELFRDCVDMVSVKAYTERGGSIADLDPETRETVGAFLRDRGMPRDTPYWRDRTGTVMVSEGRLACEQLYQRLMVTYNGSVSMCCYDWGNEHPIGYLDEQAYREGLRPYLITLEKAAARAPGFERMSDVSVPTRYVDPMPRVQTLREIWDGVLLNHVRRQHVEGRVDDVVICRGCPFKETYRWIPVSTSPSDRVTAAG